MSQILSSKSGSTEQMNHTHRISQNRRQSANFVECKMVSRPPIKIEIDPSVTEEQRCDPRFQKLLKDAEEFFNSPKSRNYKLMLGLHEGGQAYFARRAGAIHVRL